MNILGLVEIPMWIVLLLILLVSLYIYGRYPFTYWSNLGVPGPPPTIFVGNMLEVYGPGGGKAAHERWQNEYGRIYGFYNFRRPLLVVSDLDALKQVLVKDFKNFRDRHFFNEGMLVNRETKPSLFFEGGSAWKRIRTIVTPTFSSGKLKQLTHRINQSAARLSDKILESAVSGQLVDVKNVFGAFNMDVITSTAFGLEVGSQENMDEPLVHHARSLFDYGKYLKYFFLTAGIFPELCKPVFRFFNIGFFKQEDMTFFDETVSQMITQRKNDSDAQKKVDFLQLMINAEADTDALSVEEGKKLMREEIVGQALIFFIAGYETTSSTLQFIAYELARHQEVQKKVVSEIERVIGDENPTYDHCPHLKYLEAVINETLRLHPAVAQITRLTEKDTTLNGFPVPAMAGILIPIYNICRDPDFFTDPDKFDPDRFLGSQANFNPLSFTPFGFGPRQCVGMRLAILQLKLALVHILRRVIFTKSVPHEVEISDLTSILKPTVPIMIEAKVREAV